MPVLLDSPKRAERQRVSRDLDGLCRSLQPGDRIPTHTELMRQFGASERAVLRALEELQRDGRIIRRSGAGTFVAVSSPVLGDNAGTAALVNAQTVIAIARPDHSFFSLCMELLQQQVDAAGLSLICRLIGNDQEGAASAATKSSLAFSFPPPGEDGPLGFILFRRDLAPLAKQLQDQGHRVILIGTPPVDVTLPVPCIYGDHEQGGYLATSHLIDLGHRRLAFAMASDDLAHSLRGAGHERALQEAQRRGLPVQSVLISRETVQAWGDDPEQAAAYFAAPEAPTGVLVWNDHEAVTLVSLLSRAGVRVPESLSLVGYDNLPESSRVYPALTTVDHAIHQQLRMALRLLRQPEPPPSSHTVLVMPTLIPRASSAKAIPL